MTKMIPIINLIISQIIFHYFIEKKVQTLLNKGLLIQGINDESYNYTITSPFIYYLLLLDRSLTFILDFICQKPSVIQNYPHCFLKYLLYSLIQQSTTLHIPTLEFLPKMLLYLLLPFHFIT